MYPKIKKIAAFLMLFYSFNMFAHSIHSKHILLESTLIKSGLLTVSEDNIESIEIIEHSDACSIVEIHTRDGKWLLNVVASILTMYLPETTRGLCNATIGDPDVCNAVYDVTSTLVDIRGVKIFKGVTRGLGWIANRGKSVSKATVEASTYQRAKKVKQVFQFYKDMQCMEWASIYDQNNSIYYADTKTTYMFYTNSPCSMKVWVNGSYLGKTTIRYTTNNPTCGASGTISGNAEPGTYNFEAEDDCGNQWSGTLEVEYGKCNKMRLKN